LSCYTIIDSLHHGCFCYRTVTALKGRQCHSSSSGLYSVDEEKLAVCGVASKHQAVKEIELFSNYLEMGMNFSSLKQSFFIPAPTFTGRNLPDQTGKVHIVTGGYAGCGEELVRLLYEKNATVYIAGRSKEKAAKSIASVMGKHPDSTGKIGFLQLDLSNFRTVKPAVEEFVSKETRLDVLTNNAGVMTPPAGSKDSHSHELQMGTNCLGPFLFSELLQPILQRTASSSPPGSVRVTWAASIASQLYSPQNGVDFGEDGNPRILGPRTDYGQTKAGNIFLATETARRYGKSGIVSVAWNPGNLKTELRRHQSPLLEMAMRFMLSPPIYGAYTELYSGWSDDINLDNNGAYVWPWGRIVTDGLRPDLLAAVKNREQGGSGTAEKFWDWCYKETQGYR
jgi:retinol dehydrogenase 12